MAWIVPGIAALTGLLLGSPWVDTGSWSPAGFPQGCAPAEPVP